MTENDNIESESDYDRLVARCKAEKQKESPTTRECRNPQKRPRIRSKPPYAEKENGYVCPDGYKKFFKSFYPQGPPIPSDPVKRVKMWMDAIKMMVVKDVNRTKRQQRWLNSRNGESPPPKDPDWHTYPDHKDEYGLSGIAFHRPTIAGLKRDFCEILNSEEGHNKAKIRELHRQWFDIAGNRHFFNFTSMSAEVVWFLFVEDGAKYENIRQANYLKEEIGEFAGRPRMMGEFEGLLSAHKYYNT